jgi:hypothetical protein
MAVDIFTSRRTEFYRCRWWASLLPEDEDTSASSFDYNSMLPSGSFMAREMANYSNDNQEMGGVFLFNENHVVLSTNDDIRKMKANDLVEYDGDMWIVETVNKQKIKRQSQFAKDVPFSYSIALRR